MTTRRITVRREHARDWPIFKGLELPSNIGVVSVELNRRSDEAISGAVTEAARIIRPVMARAMAEQDELWLVAIGQSVHRGNRVAAYHLEKDGFWTAIEKTGAILPSGTRIEKAINYAGNSFGFGGAIKFDIGELHLALGITRSTNAVCLGLKPTQSDLVGDLIARAAEDGAAGQKLLAVSMEYVVHGSLVARGFGKFDDVGVGVEVFAVDETLDRIGPVVAETGG